MTPIYGAFGPAPTEADHHYHPPTTDDPWWQESGLFTWGDPRRGFGGELRFGLHPNQGVANLYAWIVWGGKTVYRRIIPDQPLPEGGPLNCDISVASVRTVTPFMAYDLALNAEGLTVKLRWTSHHHPVAMSLNVGGATMAAGHYDMMGEVKGEIAIGGETYPVGGAGFSDHSWGVRRSHIPASRSFFAVFSPEFYVTAMPVLTDAGRRMIGYVRHGGKVGLLGNDCRFGYRIADDWITVAGCDAYLYDEHDRGFRITGRTIGTASSQAMGHGKLVHHAVAEFECGGLLGRGILETSHPKKLMPDSVAELGLDPDSWWLNEAK